MKLLVKKTRRSLWNKESGCLGGSNSGQQALQNTQQQQAAIASATGQINNAFAGFDPAFYNNYTTANVNQGLGQLSTQLQPVQNQLGFKLAGQGLQKSSAGQQLGQSLQQNIGQNEQNIVNNANSATNTLKQNVAQQQSNLINEANVANDPASISNQALGVASSYSAPSPVAPITGMFTDWANTYLGAQNKNTYGGTLGQSTYPSLGYSGTNSGGYGSSALNSVSGVAS